ncbi:MAG: sugar isomerase [Candidatus Pelagibacter sp.]|nr:sugar isomerase [Candidatus Pelagibacter sp.]|tara:strand:- start:10454 stop:11038 length:585 start_codon:yes stop_codon:yes gene_type:complete
MKHTKLYFENILKSIQSVDSFIIEKSVLLLKNLRKKNGRLFIIGVGGSAGNASHAVNDFRKLCNIDAYTPVDNISEITSKTNDEGFETIFDSYLKLCKLSKNDILMVFSVGGGNQKKNVSVNIIKAIKFAKTKKSKIISIVGKSDGYAFNNSDLKILINVEDKKLVTPISETFQCLLWHLFVSHPDLQVNKTKW